MIPARAIRNVPSNRAIELLARVPNLTSPWAGTPQTLSPFNPLAISEQTLIGSPQECRRALEVLSEIRSGVTWWARLIQKQTPTPQASAWLLWFEETVVTPSLDPAAPGVFRRRSEERWILTIGLVNRILDGLHRVHLPGRRLLRQR
jgi:hypothetical protein